MVTPDLFNLPEDAPFDPVVVKEAEKELSGLGKSLLSGKMEMMQLTQQSAMDGGPDNPHDAILNLMDTTKIGIRALAKAVDMPRKRLHKMILGQENMPHEVLIKITEVFEKRRPDLFQ